MCADTFIERIDSSIIVLQTLKDLHIAEIINETIPRHGNWEGLGIGETVCVWITHIQCQGNHCMSHVQKWAWERRNTISAVLGCPISKSDFDDERLAIILEKFHKSKIWEKIEDKLNNSSIRVYGFSPDIVRLDFTTVNIDGVISKDGLIQFGKSKDDPSRSQVKIAIATLDPIGLPLTVSVVPGNCADDPLYLPMYHRVRKSLRLSGLLYVGDCKMGSLATRTEIQNFGDYYLCPLSDVTNPMENFPEKLDLAISSNPNGFPVISRTYADGTIKEIAHGFEELIPITENLDGKNITWFERRIYAQSFQHADIILLSLEKRVNNAVNTINELNISKRGKKVIRTTDEAQERVNVILEKNRVKGIISVSFKEDSTIKEKRQYLDRPAGVVIKNKILIIPEINHEAYSEARKIAGWKVFVTNKPVEELSLEQIILTYRNQWIIEDIFSRIKGKQISLDPIQLLRDDHIDGLIKLITIVVRVQIIIEIKISENIKKRKRGISGMYSYQENRIVERPTIASIIKAMEGINLMAFRKEWYKEVTITALNEVQIDILELLGYSCEIYTELEKKVYNMI